MGQGKSLRAIGQSLEIIRLDAFEIKKDGTDYVVHAESLPQSGSQFVLAKTLVKKHPDAVQPDREGRGPIQHQGSMRYSTMSISWLDAYGRRKRRNGSNRRGATKLSHLLRSLGEYLDRKEWSALNIAWTSDYITVDCMKGGRREHKTFSPKQLHELGFRMNFRR